MWRVGCFRPPPVGVCVGRPPPTCIRHVPLPQHSRARWGARPPGHRQVAALSADTLPFRGADMDCLVTVEDTCASRFYRARSDSQDHPETLVRAPLRYESPRSDGWQSRCRTRLPPGWTVPDSSRPAIDGRVARWGSLQRAAPTRLWPEQDGGFLVVPSPLCQTGQTRNEESLPGVWDCLGSLCSFPLPAGAARE